MLAVGSTNETFYTFGGTFLRNFYTQLNFDSGLNLLGGETAIYGSISLAKSIYASSGSSIIKKKPVIQILGLAWYWWLLIALGAILLFLLLLCGIRWLCNFTVDGIANQI